VSKENLISVKAKVLEVLPYAAFRVQIENTDHVVLVYKTGKMRIKRIRILPGDTVTVEMSLYDTNLGRITGLFRIIKTI